MRPGNFVRVHEGVRIGISTQRLACEHADFYCILAPDELGHQLQDRDAVWW